MSFDARDRKTMEVCFPSKLTEYTAAGLPIVIWGPEYSAAVRWAMENPDATLCVTDPDPRAIASALERLATDPALARRLAENAVEVGNRQFTFPVATELFERCLRQGRSAR
jgi:hypothetical protein